MIQSFLSRIGVLILWAAVALLCGNASAASYADMLAHHEVRIAVEFDRTLYYRNRGTPYGLAVELAADLSAWLSQRHADQLGHRPMRVRITPMPRGEILSALSDDKADIALGEMRFSQQINDQSALFIQPSAILRRYVLITGPSVNHVKTIDDLADMEVHAISDSHLSSTIEELNRQFKTREKGSINLATMPHELQDEDLLQMTNAGLLGAIIVPDWKAQLWKHAFPRINLHEDIEFQAEGLFGWAVLQSNTGLANELEAFVKDLIETDGMKKFRIDSFRLNSRALKDPAESVAWDRFKKLQPFFENYGKQYHLDPLLIASLGFQETALNQLSRSSGGAIGVMQLMPATGNAMRVGDIAEVQANIHAAAKYMDELLRDNFAKAKFDEMNRTLFAIASYNAGPQAIATMRDKAISEGLDPDVWLGNVEIVAANFLGVGVMTYVRNVYKYYVTYQLGLRRAGLAKR